MNTPMAAIIKKDLGGITSNKRMFYTLLIVPIVMTVVLPTVFIFIPYFVPEEEEGFLMDGMYLKGVCLLKIPRRSWERISNQRVIMGNYI